MKKIVIISLLLIIALPLLSACSLNTNKQVKTGKIKVAATIFPIYDLTRQIGGDKIETKLILTPGASPHTFEANPSLLRDLDNTKVIFSIGHQLDDWASNLLDQSNDTELLVVDENIDLKPFVDNDHEHEHENESDEHHDHEHGDIDPHYWLSPANAILIAENISHKLSDLDPANKDYYESNLNEFSNNIKTKESQWKNSIANLPNKNLVVFHDGWNYFAEYFDLNIVASFEPFPGKEPSPEYLIDVQNDIKGHNIKAMFIEPQLSKESLKNLANDINVNLGIMDPLGGVAGRETYIELIDYNINSLSENLN